MTPRLLICLTLWSLYTTGCLSGTTGQTEQPHPHTGGTSDPGLPRRPPFIIDKTELQSQRTGYPLS